MAIKSKKSGYNKNGRVIFETPTIVAIATGFKKPSQNRKTGGMIQIFIIVKEEDPIKAIYSGKDELICFQCPYRGKLIDGKLVGRACYVDLPKSVLSVYNCWRNGGYASFNNDYSLFDGREVRFGAYGEPVLIPFDMVRAIVARAHKHTGYTHRWLEPAIQGYRDYFQASCDESDYQRAESMGWRTFVVSSKALENHILCPASEEGRAERKAKGITKEVTCQTCGLCSGRKLQAKSIWIPAHGQGKKFVNQAVNAIAA